MDRIRRSQSRAATVLVPAARLPLASIDAPAQFMQLTGP